MTDFLLATVGYIPSCAEFLLARTVPDRLPCGRISFVRLRRRAGKVPVKTTAIPVVIL
jgi:hypothetical protein